jgi:hypothetical protein
MNIDSQKLEQYLAEKKYDEAKQLINDIVNAELTEEERGEGLVAFLSVYMEIMNSVNTAYRDALKEILADMQGLNLAESNSKDKIRLKQVRESLN